MKKLAKRKRIKLNSVEAFADCVCGCGCSCECWCPDISLTYTDESHDSDHGMTGSKSTLESSLEVS